MSNLDDVKSNLDDVKKYIAIVQGSIVKIQKCINNNETLTLKDLKPGDKFTFSRNSVYVFGYEPFTLIENGRHISPRLYNYVGVNHFLYGTDEELFVEKV